MSETAETSTDGTTAAEPITPTDEPDAPPAQEIDWKAKSRKWEKLAKDNSKAAEELEKLRSSAMSEQEKAVEKARKEGETTATLAGAKRLAKAEFKAAAAGAGVSLGDAEALIDFARFVTDNGDVDEAEIAKAVKSLAKLAPRPGSSGGDFGGGNGGGQPARGLDEQIAEAEKNRDFRRVIALKRQRSAVSPH